MAHTWFITQPIFYHILLRFTHDDEDPTIKVEDDLEAYMNALKGKAPAKVKNAPENRWKKALEQWNYSPT